MAIDIRFDPTGLGEVKDVALVAFKSWRQKKRLPMKPAGDFWQISLNLTEGEYQYAFLVNGSLRLNDPLANVYEPDAEEKIWSLLKVNEQGQRLFNNRRYPVHLEHYHLGARFDESIPEVSFKKVNLALNQAIVAHFVFTQVEGLHTVTLAWYTPEGELIQWADQYLVENSTGEPIEMAFRCQPNKLLSAPPLGSWSLKLLVDGAFVLADDFKVFNEAVYSR